MAYNGSVELISGIKQKNNGTFPLVDASAVRVTDEKRLDTALGEKINEPASEGTSGQVLTTDGQGGRSWTTVQGGGGGATIDDTAGIGDTTKAWSADKLAKTDTYVTPEQFGAKGDNTTDDTTALQNCITYAVSNKKMVKALNRYKTSSTITISGNYLDIDIGTITYSGNSYAVSISGSYSSIKIDVVACANGKGILMTRTSSTNCRANKIAVNRLYAYSHAVEFVGNGDYILYNTFDIRYIKSDTGDCYHCEEKTGENVFMNSSCSCASGWAIYKANGRYYNFTLEADVLNGIYIEAFDESSSYNYFSGFRIREMVDKLVARISGYDPSQLGGTLIKYVGSSSLSRFISEDFVPYEAIDVSEMDTVEDLLEESPVPYQILARMAFYNIIDAPIRYGNWDTQNGYIVPGKQMIVIGGKKICVPAYETVCTITEADYDMRDTEVALNDAKIYATKMIIGVDNCVIHLPTSYCAYGYSEFIVDQNQGHLCTIYDSKDSTTPIFNGSARGAGVYRFKAYCNPTVNAINQRNPSYADIAYNDTENYTWEITKIDQSGGGGSVTLNYITPEDYGAVGDGVTDDSNAVQSAINAGYNVYFGSNKTYYLASEVTINHDCHLYGGKSTVIKTKTPSGGTANRAFVCTGTLKATTTLTTDYKKGGDSNTANSGDRFKLTDMSEAKIGDIMVIESTDQYYSYARQYYYLGMTLLISDVTNDYIFSCDAMPWDLNNTANTTVKIYDAPTVIIENLNFISDQDSIGTYRYQLELYYCKNSVIRNCNVTEADNGVYINECVNTLVDGLNISRMPGWIGGVQKDHYGVGLYSSTNTTIQRVMVNAANSGIDMSGTIPSVNTRILKCNLDALTRHNGFGMHENAYNTTLEDCVIAGMTGYGTMYINRCRFIRSYRNEGQSVGISIRGSHNPEWARYFITNCEFEERALTINIAAHVVQSPIQAFDNIFEEIVIRDCHGATISYTAATSQYVLSNTVRNMTLSNLKNFYEFYHTSGSAIENLVVENCEFGKDLWLNDHASHLAISDIRHLRLKSDYPKMEKIYADVTKYGGKYYLPEGTAISCSSQTQTDYYVACGKNLASNNPADLSVGSVTGAVGEALTRTEISAFSNSLSVNSNNELVFTQINSAANASIYSKCLVYVPANRILKVSCKLKNTGETTGATFRLYIVYISCDTGLVVYRNNGTAGQASASGEVITHSRQNYYGDCMALFYLYCNTPVANAETTLSEYVAEVMDCDFDDTLSYKAYTGSSRTGDGILTSVAGENNLMTTATSFSMQFKANYMDNNTAFLPSATGVSF